MPAKKLLYVLSLRFGIPKNVPVLKTLVTKRFVKSHLYGIKVCVGAYVLEAKNAIKITNSITIYGKF